MIVILISILRIFMRLFAALLVAALNPICSRLASRLTLILCNSTRFYPATTPLAERIHRWLYHRLVLLPGCPENIGLAKSCTFPVLRYPRLINFMLLHYILIDWPLMTLVTFLMSIPIVRRLLTFSNLLAVYLVTRLVFPTLDSPSIRSLTTWVID